MHDEANRIKNNEQTSRNWSDEQRKYIIARRKPKFNVKTIHAHHSYSVSQYPHLASYSEGIWPATFNEHFYGWHGGNWKNSLPGKPIVYIFGFLIRR